MKPTSISRGGQIQVPAVVRRRWGTRRVIMEDRGASLLIRPIPDDPIEAATGSLAGPGPTSEQIRQHLRDEETDGSERVQRRKSRST